MLLFPLLPCLVNYGPWICSHPLVPQESEPGSLRTSLDLRFQLSGLSPS